MAGRTAFDFSGQTVVITGGGTGIGAGMAECFARANANVVIGGRRRAPLEATAARFPDRITFVQMDVGKDEDRRRTLDAVLERHGRLDILINNAVACTHGSFEDRTADEIAAMYGIILQASTMLIHLALPSLKSTKGCVINISSVIGRAVPFPPMGLSVYSAAKAGVNQLTRALASELGIFGIRVNAIAPGPTAGEPSKSQATTIHLCCSPSSTPRHSAAMGSLRILQRWRCSSPATQAAGSPGRSSTPPAAGISHPDFL